MDHKSKEDKKRYLAALVYGLTRSEKVVFVEKQYDSEKEKESR